MYLRNDFDNEDLTAMREFLHYFIKKRNELTKKLEKLSLLERSGPNLGQAATSLMQYPLSGLGLEANGLASSNSNLLQMERDSILLDKTNAS